MSMTLAEIEAEALKLSSEERERLLDALAASLDDQGSLDEAWGNEIARRVEELDAGNEAGIPAEQVFAELRAKLSASRKQRA